MKSAVGLELGHLLPPADGSRSGPRPSWGVLAGSAARVDYYGNPEASTRKTRGDWLHTGEMGWKDDRGWFCFAHRMEEGGMRKLGEFISEDLIRRLLAEEPEVLDVHVYGVQARSGAPGDSDVVAAVVVEDPDRLDVAAVFTRCAARLERTHVPNYLQIVDELPKTASRKVQTRLLVASFDPSPPRLHARDKALAG
jgi:crotonobetaine/carnitine-CoA ligase